jgi:hypothetical protein
MKNLLFLFIAFSINVQVKAQDIITTLNGDEIKSKVMEVSSTEVKYKKFDNLSGPLFVVLKSELLMIKYENGNKDVFTNSNSKSNSSFEANSNGNENLCILAQQDAAKYYSNYKGASGGTLLTTIVGGGIIGLIPAIACSSTPPSNANLNMPGKYTNNSEYVNCYTQEARKIKSRKVWTNFGVGCGVLIILFAALGG